MKSKKFEDYIDVINKELEKRRSSYQLHALPYLDVEDFFSECRLRIWNKFELYDQSKPFVPWVNTVIHNFTTNWWRDKLGKYQSPCVRCHLHADGHCNFTKSGVPDNTCPLFAKWQRNKESAFNIKMPVSIENHINEINEKPQDEHINYTEAKKRLEKELKNILKPLEYRIYVLIYKKHKTEGEVTKILNLKVESGRESSKWVRDIVVKIKRVSKEILYDSESDIL